MWRMRSGEIWAFDKKVNFYLFMPVASGHEPYKIILMGQVSYNLFIRFHHLDN